MAASRNSKSSRVFSALAALLLAAGAGWAGLWFTLRNGWTLYYGDAEAHLNIARRILDSRTPGYEQIGTVWLPLPHALLLPLARDESAWQSGLAGAGPGTVAFVLACLFLFLTLRRLFGGHAPAFAGMLVFALNPNLLYLQAVPMSEPLFLGAALGAVYFLVVLAQSASSWPALPAGIFATLASLVRYEGWFLLPFLAVAAFAVAEGRRIRALVLFAIPAGFGPVYWFLHNAWCCGDWLEFYRGPWSAKAIYQRQLASGMERYPGDGDWLTAARYFFEAARLAVGWPLAVAGVAGLVVCLKRRVWWPAAILALAPFFYIWSMVSSGTPIYVPHLYPFSSYNTRYGLALLPLLALGGAGLAALAPVRWRWLAAFGVVAGCSSPWLLTLSAESWICWKESQVNSEVRRRWTAEAAGYLRTHYRGGGILSSFGDLTGAVRAAGIPIRETLHEGNGPAWQAAMQRPELFLHEEWALAISGDSVATALLRSEGRGGPRYRCVKIMEFRGGPVIEVYRRESTGIPVPRLPAIEEEEEEEDGDEAEEPVDGGPA
jgi:hypothetical protein